MWNPEQPNTLLHTRTLHTTLKPPTPIDIPQQRAQSIWTQTFTHIFMKPINTTTKNICIFFIELFSLLLLVILINFGFIGTGYADNEFACIHCVRHWRIMLMICPHFV